MSGAIRIFMFCLSLAPLPLLASGPLLDEIIVTANKSEQRLGSATVSVGIIEESTLNSVRHTHLNELLQRVPGVWISRGNGQEHLTAIRSPVLTGAGSCGAFVMAQDGISLRSPGFCNVNELFESTSELAGRIEVVRGPDSSIYGSNALHGVVNVITPAVTPGLRKVSFEAGPDDYYRTRLNLSSESLRVDFSGTTDGGYKDDSGFDQQKLLLKHQHTGKQRAFNTTLAVTNLNQETAGFVIGHNSYKIDRVKRDNPNPEAYRDAQSFRLASEISQQMQSGTLVLKPYLRHVDMTFLQHFLPGQATEENGHDSLGLMLLWNSDSWWQAGIETEYTRGYLEETQPNPTIGSAFLAATIPPGKHYDYDVDARMAGLFLSFYTSVGAQLTLSGSLRYQHLRYDYDNNMIDGRTRDDGIPCGFGGCRFSRPADRQDSFSNLSPHLGFTYQLTDQHQVFGSISRGFRAPQATELYRLQDEQDIANIDTVEMDSVELGFRGAGDRLSYALSLFHMEKDNFIFRDTNRRNVDNGKTSHKGLELDQAVALGDDFTARLAFTHARHRFENNPALSASPLQGNDIDTAPRTLGSASLEWQVSVRHQVELEWVHIGKYYVDPENQQPYDGHDLLHLRGNWMLSEKAELFYRIMNITDRDYADRADFAFGQDRYFIGTPRALYLGVKLGF